MMIVIFGASGFIGQQLTRVLLEAAAEQIVWISRSPQSTTGTDKNQDPRIIRYTWEQVEDQPDLLEKSSAFVNLAGEPISQRWTADNKRRILQSRLDAVGRIIAIISRLKHKPGCVVSSSAIGIYGMSETKQFTEDSPLQATDFLAEVVKQWEAAWLGLRNIRVVTLRVGIVLGLEGGVLPKVAMPFRLGAGGPVGSGNQWMSWIHMKDMARLIVFCLFRDDISGPVNATAPYPVRNRDFGRLLGKAIHRPYWLPAPAFALRLVLGELSALVLEGQHVTPHKLLANGFTFKYATLQHAFSDLYQKRSN